MPGFRSDDAMRSRVIRFVRRLGVFFSVALCAASMVGAQGEDGTPSERNILILGELLPGRFDNVNQHYFDGRLKRDEAERHERLSVELRRVDLEDLGTIVFRASFQDPSESKTQSEWVYTLEVDYPLDAVRMKAYHWVPDEDGDGASGSTSYVSGCDLLWREEAGQFHGRLEENTCAASPNTRVVVESFLSEDAFWIRLADRSESHFVLERARSFSCDVDVPGVGGGRDIPYKRYLIDDIHDKGGKEWLSLDDGREIYITLQNVRWPVNNLKNIFTRHSFVMYVGTREDGEEKEVSYAWTVPSAQRIGMNLKWMLVNCYMMSNEDVQPYFKTEPLR